MSAELVSFSHEVQSTDANLTYDSLTAVKNAFIDIQNETKTLVSLKYVLTRIKKENAHESAL